MNTIRNAGHLRKLRAEQIRIERLVCKLSKTFDREILKDDSKERTFKKLDSVTISISKYKGVLVIIDLSFMQIYQVPEVIVSSIKNRCTKAPTDVTATEEIEIGMSEGEGDNVEEGQQSTEIYI